MPDACIYGGIRSFASDSVHFKLNGDGCQDVCRSYLPGKNKLGPLVMEFYARSLERGIAARSKIAVKHFFDYRFKDFVDKPLTLISDTMIFSLPLDDDLKISFTDYIEQHPKQHGDHRYTFETFGLTEAMILERLNFIIMTQSIATTQTNGVKRNNHRIKIQVDIIMSNEQAVRDALRSVESGG